MKTKLLNLFIIIILVVSLIGCGNQTTDEPPFTPNIPGNNPGDEDPGTGDKDPGTEDKDPGTEDKDSGNEDKNPDLGDDDDTFGDPIEDTGALDGELSNEQKNFEINCISGTKNCFKIENDTILFTNILEDTVCSISGQLTGNIIINVNENYKFDLELHGFTIQSATTNPIVILNGNEVSIKAKKDYMNYIYDNREKIDETDESLYSGAIHSLVDLEIGGKGKLTIVSKNNNGIHSKDDLQVKNLDLFISCVDNALKGNDSVEIEEATINLVSTKGDGIKTTNSDISEKGNQRGTITISNSIIDIYSACDGIDAAYNVIIDGENTKNNIYTDKYSNYSEEVTNNNQGIYFVRNSNNSHKYSVKYYNSNEDYEWVDATYHSSKFGGKSTYYYYSFPKKANYSKIQVFMYSSTQSTCQETQYVAKTELLTTNSAYDTLAFSTRGNTISNSWTNYETTTQNRPGGPGGGMQEGNNDKSDYSTKGIKSFNEIIINNGIINIKSYDDAIHANNDQALENNQKALGNVTINKGTITIYSNDDGIHADGILTINNGKITVTNSYEGLEGIKVIINDGVTSIQSRDDGINATATSGVAIQINGGTNYVYCTGDGLDSNSRDNYQGIVFVGGKTVVIANSNGNSAIDSEKGYSYQGGYVIAIMPGGGGGMGGMTGETINCSNFTGIGTKQTIALSTTNNIMVTVNNEEIVTLKSPVSISSAFVVFLGSNKAEIKSVTAQTNQLDQNNVCWLK